MNKRLKRRKRARRRKLVKKKDIYIGVSLATFVLLIVFKEEIAAHINIKKLSINHLIICEKFDFNFTGVSHFTFSYLYERLFLP